MSSILSALKAASTRSSTDLHSSVSLSAVNADALPLPPRLQAAEPLADAACHGVSRGTVHPETHRLQPAAAPFGLICFQTLYTWFRSFKDNPAENREQPLCQGIQGQRRQRPARGTTAEVWPSGDRGDSSEEGLSGMVSCPARGGRGVAAVGMRVCKSALSPGKAYGQAASDTQPASAPSRR